MSKLPVLAIVGRPNVGKSALFNRLCHRRLAIVEETEGVTRDRLYAQASFNGFSFLVVDTGGINPNSEDPFQDVIRQQAESAIEEADSIILVVDGQVGPQAEDVHLARLLLKTKKPVCIAVNKVDSPLHEESLYPFYSLGIRKMLGVSAAQALHIDELLALAWEGFQPPPPSPPFEGIKIAFVGRPNVGKSSLINAILEQERCVVSPLAGTTRDQVEVPFTFDDKPFLLVDTAGVRRKKTVRANVEHWAGLRTLRAIEEADICLLVIDVQEGVTAQEKRLAGQIEEAGKGCVVILNKWDLVKGFRMEHCLKALRDEIPFLAHCPTLITSAVSRRQLDQLFPLILSVQEARGQRIPTGQLNRFLERAMAQYQPPHINGKRLRVYYLTQIETHPPRFVLFVNNPKLITDGYKRYLVNQFRLHFPLPGIPLEFLLRGKKVSPHEHSSSAPFKLEEPTEEFEPDASYGEDYEPSDEIESIAPSDE